MRGRSLERASIRGARLLALGLLLACSKSHEGPIELCPTLVGPGGSWSGIALPPGSLGADGCVEVRVDGQVVTRARAAPDGSLAVRFRAPRDLTGYPMTLEFSDGFREVRGAESTEATIAYTSDTRPLLVNARGRVTFLGWLASSPDSTEIEAVWLANWTSSSVLEVSGPPLLDERFTATMVGSPGDEVSPVSRHLSGGVGGCWWPLGGGGVAACSEEGWMIGACVSGAMMAPCTGRGCTPIPSMERESGLGGPEESHRIPAAPAYVPDAAPPPDTGVPSDGGLP